METKQKLMKSKNYNVGVKIDFYLGYQSTMKIFC